VWRKKISVFIYKNLNPVNYYSVEIDTSLFNTNSTAGWRDKSDEEVCDFSYNQMLNKNLTNLTASSSCRSGLRQSVGCSNDVSWATHQSGEAS
jgi:hypothetical protein